MKILFSILLLVAVGAQAGVPDVLVGFHNNGTNDFPGGAVYFTLGCHTSYNGTAAVFAVSPTLPAIPAKHSAIVDIPLPDIGYNLPNLDWVQLTFFGGQQTGPLPCVQSGLNAQARCRQVVTFDFAARSVSSQERKLYPVTSHGKVVRFILK